MAVAASALVLGSSAAYAGTPAREVKPRPTAEVRLTGTKITDSALLKELRQAGAHVVELHSKGTVQSNLVRVRTPIRWYVRDLENSFGRWR
jgi:hypothetical protein